MNNKEIRIRINKAKALVEEAESLHSMNNKFYNNITYKDIEEGLKEILNKPIESET